MTIKNSLAQMVAFTILATSAVGFSSYNSAYGAADQGDAKKVEVKKNTSPSLSFVRGGTKEVCKEVYKLLQLPENSSYVSDYKNVNTLFFIPSSNEKFSTVEWKVVPENEFQTALPMRYDRIINYARKEPEKKWGIKSVSMVEIPAFNSNKQYPIYEVSIMNGTYQKYIQMPIEFQDHENFFDNNLSETVPFFFNKEVYFSALYKSGKLYIWHLTKRFGQQEYLGRVCHYQRIVN